MLSGEGNAGERWKRTMGLISKKTTLHVQHTFLYISLPLFCTTTTWNVQKLPSYTYKGGNFVRFLVPLFSLPLIFTLHLIGQWLVTASISQFITSATNFSCSSSKKKISPLFLSLALDLCRPFSRWASLACHLLSLFLCLSLALYSKFVDMTIKLSCLILETTRIQKQFPLSVFVFIDSLVVSTLQHAGGYAIFLQKSLQLHLGCHTCWLSYFTLVCLWCGRTVGRASGWTYGHVITKFCRIGRLLHFLTHGAPLSALRARELRYYWIILPGLNKLVCMYLQKQSLGALAPDRAKIK